MKNVTLVFTILITIGVFVSTFLLTNGDGLAMKLAAGILSPLWLYVFLELMWPTKPKSKKSLKRLKVMKNKDLLSEDEQNSIENDLSFRWHPFNKFYDPFKDDKY